MSYIGATPLIGNFQKCDAITTSATDTFNLLVGGVAVSPATPQNCIVSLNGVIQAPTTAYTIVAATIVFASALTTSDVIDFIVILGNVLDIGIPSDDTVTTAKIADNNVTLAKLADGTQGDVLYYGASGAPTLLGAGTSGDFLKTQGAGANPTWASAGGGMWTKILSQEITSTTAAMDFVDGTGGCVLDGTYTYYMIMFRNAVLGTADKKLLVEISTDTGSTWKTSGYKSFAYQAAYTSGQTARTAYSDSMTVMNSVTTTAGEGCSGYIMFTTPALAIKPSCSYNIAMSLNAYSDGVSWSGGGKYDTATAWDGIRFESSSGTITTLQATLYGHTD